MDMTELAGLDWIAGESTDERLQLWALDRAAKVLATRVVAAPGGGDAALLAEVWPEASGVPLLLAGDLPADPAPLSRAVPCTAVDAGSLIVADGAGRVLRVAGLRQDAPAGYLGAETVRIAGFLGHAPDFDGVLCLAGRRSAWVRISAGEVVSFQSFLSGPLAAAVWGGLDPFAMMAAGPAADQAESFARAVERTLSRPERLAAHLAELAAEARIGGLSAAHLAAGAAGLAIGAELAAARAYWLGQELAVLGSAGLAGLYASTLGRQGVPTATFDGAGMALAGLCRAWSLRAGDSRKGGAEPGP